MTTIQLPKSVLTKKQVKTISIYKGDITSTQLNQLDECDRQWVKDWKSNRPIITFKLRYDDECGNGHNTFAITGEGFESWGCLHDYFRIFCPDFAHLIKLHNCSSDSPMHYVGNTMYHAGDKDCSGKRKGEPSHFSKVVRVDGGTPDMTFSKDFLQALASCDDFTRLSIVEVPHSSESRGSYVFAPKYTFSNHSAEWYQCPFNTALEAQQHLDLFRKEKFEIVEIPLRWSEGKEPDLEAARSSAIAPEATLEQLQDREWLEARLPQLMNQFKEDMESLGFIY